ncbi:hypothetical protein KKA95_03875 [Patescibacteria group bacterium]|nr:hypothetical protein [Patescibacteria group bacterium]
MSKTIQEQPLAIDDKGEITPDLPVILGQLKDAKKEMVAPLIVLGGLLFLKEYFKEETEESDEGDEELATTNEKLDSLKRDIPAEQPDADEELEPGNAPSDTEDKCLVEFSESAELEVLKSLPPGERVVRAVELAVNEYETDGKHCWDWVNKVYSSVGCGRERVYQNLHYEGTNARVAPHATILDGELKAPDGSVLPLNPGDHIYYNNRNTTDTHGNHSVIFLGWTNKSRGIARVAGYDARGYKSRIHNADFINNPITHISSAVQKSDIDLALLEPVKDKKDNLDVA